MEELAGIEAVRSAFQSEGVNRVLEKAVEGVSEGAARVDATKVAEFNRLMETSGIRPENQVVAPVPVSDIPFASRVERSFRLAEVQQFTTYERLHGLISKSEDSILSVSELMTLQFEAANLALQQELVAKVVDRGSQAIQTLFKNQ